MICPKCKAKGVPNSVLGKEFWYCRTCKDEISLEEPKPAEPKKPDFWFDAISGTFNTSGVGNNLSSYISPYRAGDCARCVIDLSKVAPGAMLTQGRLYVIQNVIDYQGAVEIYDDMGQYCRVEDFLFQKVQHSSAPQTPQVQTSGGHITFSNVGGNP